MADWQSRTGEEILHGLFKIGICPMAPCLSHRQFAISAEMWRSACMTSPSMTLHCTLFIVHGLQVIICKGLFCFNTIGINGIYGICGISTYCCTTVLHMAIPRHPPLMAWQAVNRCPAGSKSQPFQVDDSMDMIRAHQDHVYVKYKWNDVLASLLAG